jgi:hypothetical protein
VTGLGIDTPYQRHKRCNYPDPLSHSHSGSILPSSGERILMDRQGQTRTTGPEWGRNAQRFAPQDVAAILQEASSCCGVTPTYSPRCQQAMSYYPWNHEALPSCRPTNVPSQ